MYLVHILYLTYTKKMQYKTFWEQKYHYFRQSYYRDGHVIYQWTIFIQTLKTQSITSMCHFDSECWGIIVSVTFHTYYILYME